MENQAIITVGESKYVYKDIPGEGRCLVPYKGSVTTQDVIDLKSYRTAGEFDVDIISMTLNEGGRFYTIKKRNSHVCYYGAGFSNPETLADLINNFRGCYSFKSWIS